LKAIAVGPGYVEPEAYEVTPSGCHRWTRATVSGRPVVYRDGRQQNVRRVMTPGIGPNEVIKLSCGDLLCVNPDHFIRAPSARTYKTGRATGRGLLNDVGMPKPNSYTVNGNGCHLWKGQIDPTKGPVGVYRGKRVSVRSRVMGERQGRIIKSICGEEACINTRHLYKPGEVSAWRRAEFIRRRTHENLTRTPDELRDLRWIRADLARLIDQDPDNRAGMTANARWALEHYAKGFTLAEMAKIANVTPQALSIQIKLADRRLRKYIAGDPLQ